MRTVAEQQEIVRALASPLGTERLPLAEAEGRVLASDVVAKLPVPPFTNSAMDGYAVRASDVLEAPVVLEVTNFQSSSSVTARNSQSSHETWFGTSSTGPGVDSTSGLYALKRKHSRTSRRSRAFMGRMISRES